MTLLEALVHAKRLDVLKTAKQVAVFRELDGQRIRTVFDLEAIRLGKEPDPEIQSDDVILVEEPAARRSLGDRIKASSLFSGRYASRSKA